MMKWAAFYDFILPELPAAQVNLVDLHLRQAAIEFLEETQVWVAVADPINTTAGVATYQLAPPAAVLEADVVQVRVARFEGTLLTFTTMDELRQSAIDYEVQTSPMPRGFTQYTQSTLTLVPAPDHSTTGGLTMKLALRPSLTATGVPDWIGTKWVQELSMGAKAMLMSMVGKPWSSPEGAMGYRQQFEGAKTRATIEANRSFTRANSQIQLKR